MPDGTSSVLVQGVRRVRIDVGLHHPPLGRLQGLAFDESEGYDERLKALACTALASFERCTKMSERFGEVAYVQALNIERVGALADFLVAQLEPPLALRQDLLETLDPELRLRKACQLLQRELNVLELEHKIHVEVQQEADRGQREFFLLEQLKAIQRELSEPDPSACESGNLQEPLL